MTVHLANEAKILILLLDSRFIAQIPNDTSYDCYCWSDDGHSDHLSLSEYIDSNGEVLRNEFLNLLNNWQKTKVKGVSLAEYLTVNGLSFWYLSRIYEKSPWKSSYLFDLFGLLAIERIWSRTEYSECLILGNKQGVADILEDWFLERKINYRWDGIKAERSNRSARQLYFALPGWMQALIYFLKHVIQQYRPYQKKTIIQESDITLLSYFPNFSEKEATENKFVSNYWRNLPDVLVNLSYRLHWIWHWEPGKNARNVSELFSWRTRFSNNGQIITLLQDNLTLHVLIKSWKQYYRLRNRAKNIEAGKIFYTNGGMNLFPLLETEWNTSFFGKTALENCIVHQTYSKLFSSQTVNKGIGLYLMENQAWERILVHTWHQTQSLPIYGCAHTGISFFDLRHYYSQQVWEEISPSFNRLLPDKILLNGADAIEKMKISGYPEDRLVAVETLRFEPVAEFRNGEAPSNIAGSNATTTKKRILVVTDYLPRLTQQQLSLLSEFIRKNDWQAKYEFSIKPHPFCPVDKMIKKMALDDFVSIINKPLREILPDFDLVYCSNFTNAILEAAQVRLTICVHRPDSELNLSPLRGSPTVLFVANVSQLESAFACSEKTTLINNYFFYDSTLPRWRAFLGQECGKMLKAG